MSWYKMHRGWQENPMLANEPYSERDAWCWIIENAVFEKTIINVKGNPVILQPGQLSYSYRFLSKKWQWHISKVRRFLDKLEKWQSIDTVTDTGQTVISVCNYSNYQANRHRSDTASDTGATQERHKEEEYNNIINTTVDVRARDSQSISSDTKNHISVGETVWEITGWADDPNMFPNYSRIQQWLADGWDPELDIYPTIRTLIAKKTGPPPKSLRYFEQAIADAYAYRNSPIPKGNPNGPARSKTTRRTGHQNLLAASGFADLE